MLRQCFLNLSNNLKINGRYDRIKPNASHLNGEKYTESASQPFSDTGRRVQFPKGCGCEKERYVDKKIKKPVKCETKCGDTTGGTKQQKKNVCCLGSGNWGSAISKIIGVNAHRLPAFNDCVKMYVHEEEFEGRKLHDIINERHENVKYLPGHKLPENVFALSDAVETAKDADIIIIVLPHQYAIRICRAIVGTVKPTATAISLVKGVAKAEGGGIELVSQCITRLLRIPCSVLMGANLATEVAEGKFGEATIGCSDLEHAGLLRDLFQNKNFKISVVDDVVPVELCGALKNIVAVGVGFCDGLKLGDNTKSAVIRLGFMEIIFFIEIFFSGGRLSTYLESCGIADLITTCYGGRNRKVGAAFVTAGKTLQELEAILLNGQKLQGPDTASDVYFMLKSKGLENKFPLFTTIHRICINELKPIDLIDSLRDHPDLKRNKILN